jgi:multicomponent Na+:H+ antiporter subunit D
MLLTSVFVIPLATAFLTLIFSHQARWQTLLSLFGGFCFLIFSLMLLYQVDTGSELIRVSFGDWPAPFGIEFVADRLTGC